MITIYFQAIEEHLCGQIFPDNELKYAIEEWLKNCRNFPIITGIERYRYKLALTKAAILLKK